MARRLVNAPPVEAKLPAGMLPVDLERTLDELVQRWKAESPTFDPRPHVERVRALPEPTRKRLAELVVMLELKTHAELNRERAAKEKIVADALLAAARMPESLDLQLLLLVRASYNVSQPILARVVAGMIQAAREPLFALLFRDSDGCRYDLVDALEGLGIDDSMIDRALEGIDRAPFS
jgi:hypothetical protein